MTLRPGFPIRKSADQRLLAPPPGFSQRATSFIASQCQGIHQMPLLRAFRATPNGKHHRRNVPPRATGETNGVSPKAQTRRPPDNCPETLGSTKAPRLIRGLHAMSAATFSLFGG